MAALAKGLAPNVTNLRGGFLKFSQQMSENDDLILENCCSSVSAVKMFEY